MQIILNKVVNRCKMFLTEPLSVLFANALKDPLLHVYCTCSFCVVVKYSGRVATEGMLGGELA